MDKRFIAVMLAAISVALVGLVAIQVVWIRNTVELRKDQFEQGVSTALFRVSERMERTERMHDLRRHRKGKRMLAELESLRAAAHATAPELLDDEPEEVPEEGFPPPPDPPMDWTEPGERVRHLEGVVHERFEELVTDMVRGILYSEIARDIKQRIDPAVLDSALRAELMPLGIEGELHWGIFNAHGKRVRLPGETEGDTTSLADAPFKERLFRHDLGGAEYKLHVRVEHARRSMLGDLWPMLAASVVFLLIIAVGFGYTIRTILRQKRISDIRNDLVNNLTHELKTPISTIGLACEALADPSLPRTEEQVRTFTGMIRDENKRLGALVENVLRSAVQDSGHMVVKPVDLDLHAVINDVVRSSTMQVSRRNGRIELDLGAEIHRLQADRIHLTNLLYNLIDNAVKYTEQEPRLRITTRSDDNGVTLSIADNGIGIAQSEQRKIFDRLYRVPTGNLHNAKGFGLGLSYVKSVVDRHGGRIRVDSTPGQGSTFHIHLPFHHGQQHQAPRRRG